MPTDLGSIAAGGVGGAQDALRQMIADRLKQALLMRQQSNADALNAANVEHLGAESYKLRQPAPGKFSLGANPIVGEDTKNYIPVLNQETGDVTYGPPAGVKPTGGPKKFQEVPQGVDVPNSDKPVPAVFDAQDAVYRDMTPEHNVIPGARAHKEPYAGVPVIGMQGPLGPGGFDKRTNVFTPATVAGTGEPVGRPVPAALADKASGIEQSVSILQKLIATPKDHIIGPAQGRLRQFATALPGYDTPSDVADFIADTNTLTNSVIKAITGAQMSEVEATRIKGQIPLITDQATVWASKANKTIENLQLLHDRMLALAGTPKTLAQGAPKPGQYKAGDAVMYQGKARTVQSVNPDGTLVLAPIKAGGG